LINITAFWHLIQNIQIVSNPLPHENLGRFLALDLKSNKELLMVGKIKLALKEFQQNDYLKLYGTQVNRTL
jgi:hypothetical protein